MKILIKSAAICLLWAFFTTNAVSDDGIEALSPELRGLLVKEMTAIQDAMQRIIPAYISGDLSEVAEIAGQIEKSFILKQQINEAQMHELHEKLPGDFMEQDKKFHKYAGMLEHVSRNNHTELVGFYYSRLLESCVGCHTEHAGHRFPGLTENVSNQGHHH